VAGKTGTAQKPVPGLGFRAGKYVASFAGFAPAEHPRLAVLVVVDEPQGSHYGGVVAAPAFREICERALTVLRIPPDAPSPPPQLTVAKAGHAT
jgi:cell division protein FtsI (penicillin-binding protein 3)